MSFRRFAGRSIGSCGCVVLSSHLAWEGAKERPAQDEVSFRRFGGSSIGCCGCVVPLLGGTGGVGRVLSAVHSLEEELPVLDSGYALNLYSGCGKFGLMLLSSGG